MRIEFRKERVYNLTENEIETEYVAYLVSDEEDGITLDVRLSDSTYSSLENAIENVTIELNNFIAKKQDINIKDDALLIDEDEIIQYEIEIPEPGIIL